MTDDKIDMQQLQPELSDYLEIVDWAMKQYIWSSKTIPDLSYDDLYQVGCLGLMKAAKKYNPQKGAKFSTFAEIVVKNTIIDYARKVLKREEKMTATLLTDEDGFQQYDIRASTNVLLLDAELSEKLILEFLDSVKIEYTGVTLKGIEAIKFRVMGYSNKDIAELYGVSNNHVGAWITRASQKLRKNRQFIRFIKEC